MTYDLTADFAALEHSLSGVFGLFEVAEEEIEKAQKRHGEPVGERGPIWNTFRHLKPGFLADSEMLYRAHCVELLDRVAEGRDLRPPTRPEMIAALARASKSAPLTSAAAGLYIELFEEVFPAESREAFSEHPNMAADYRRVHGQQMDDHREWLRGTLLQADRGEGK
ncbi:hypothetical protein [Actinocorallia libanotica]|uniref:Uncharacterized protein n=1 Tax=Actinocorallia libanotica TaxID=46162 RepID=A0ABN1QQG1_9ACTN